MEPTNFPLKHGMNRQVIGPLAEPGMPYTLSNLRHSRTKFGVLEQTPYFYNWITLSTGTYYDGGSQSEPSNSEVQHITNDLFITSYVVREWSTQLQVIYQSTQPAAVSVNTGLKLVINSVSGLGLNLGGALDVEMTSGTQFRWRKNGGAWTTGVTASTAGVSIDSGNATLYFLANSGFSGETWAWTRTDRSTDGAVAGTDWGVINGEYYRREYFFVARGGRIMVVKRDSSGARYVISVGYRKVFGQCLTFFQDHLVVGGYGTASFAWTTAPQNRTVGWSDLNDADNFIATDVNEADTKELQGNTPYDVVTTTAAVLGLFINGIGVLYGNLYVFTSFGTYQTSYLGLPLVFNFTQGLDLCTPTAPGKYVVSTKSGFYVITQDDIVFFDGTGSRSIGAQVVDFLAAFNVTSSVFSKFSAITYDPSASEVIVIPWNNTGMLVYQERYGTWYYRPISLDTGLDGRPTSFGLVNPTSNTNNISAAIGTANLKVHIEDVNFANQPIKDSTAGTAYQTPYIVFHPYVGKDLAIVKEIFGTYIGATRNNFSRGTVSPSGTYYSTGSQIRITVNWASLDHGMVDEATAWSTNANAYWDSSKTDGTVSYPRIPFRGLAIALIVEGTQANKPPGYVAITGFSAYIRHITPVPR